MNKLYTNPICNYHTDCFANIGGECSCLTNTDFNGRDCPFYKTERVQDSIKEKVKSRSGAFCFP